MIIFDAVSSQNYVKAISGGEVVQCFPIQSVVSVVSKKELQGFQISPMLAGQIGEYGWDSIDWNNCIPAPQVEIKTRNQQLEYLCKIFPTTMDSVINTEKSTLMTQRIGKIDCRNKQYYAPLSGEFVLNEQDTANCFLPSCTIEEIFFNIFNSNSSVSSTVQLLKNGVSVAEITVPPNTTGMFYMRDLLIDISKTDSIVLRINMVNGSGSVYFSPITTIFIIK